MKHATRAAGFTLIEALVVLALMATAFALFAGTLVAALPGQQLRGKLAQVLNGYPVGKGITVLFRLRLRGQVLRVDSDLYPVAIFRHGTPCYSVRCQACADN